MSFCVGFHGKWRNSFECTRGLPSRSLHRVKKTANQSIQNSINVWQTAAIHWAWSTSFAILLSLGWQRKHVRGAQTCCKYTTTYFSVLSFYIWRKEEPSVFNHLQFGEGLGFCFVLFLVYLLCWVSDKKLRKIKSTNSESILSEKVINCIVFITNPLDIDKICWETLLSLLIHLLTYSSIIKLIDKPSIKKVFSSCFK